MRQLVTQPTPDTQRERQVLTQATLRAAEFLALPQSALAVVLGASTATVSRMKSGAYLLDRGRKEWELATLWVRLFRSLDSITGGHDEASRAWFHGANHDLGGTPAELVRQVTGLVRVVEYLDAARARI